MAQERSRRHRGGVTTAPSRSVRASTGGGAAEATAAPATRTAATTATTATAGQRAGRVGVVMGATVAAGERCTPTVRPWLWTGSAALARRGEAGHDGSRAVTQRAVAGSGAERHGPLSGEGVRLLR